MNTNTLKALKGSIRKWEGIVAGKLEDDGSDNCPLCRLFLHSGSTYCAGCPVSTKTGLTFCNGTPYQNEWIPIFQDGSYKRTVFDDETRDAAQAELDFLKSLLPKTHGTHRKPTR